MAGRFNPDPVGSPSFRKGIPIRPEDLRILEQMAKGSARTAGTGDFNDLGAGLGTQFGGSLVPAKFWARITAPPLPVPNGSNPIPLYNFREVQDDGTGYGWLSVPKCIRGHITDQGTYNAYPLSGSATIPVPGPPLYLVGGIGPYYYVVTSLWTNTATGADNLQSELSNEVLGDIGVLLSWTAPAVVPGYTLTGYQVWKGVFSDGENVLVATLGPTTTSYTDVGDGTFQYPILGGNVGPIVLMSPLAALDYFKFVDVIAETNLPLAWVGINSDAPTTVFLHGRAVSDATIVSGSPEVVSPADANFTADDVNKYIAGPGIPQQRTVNDAASTAGSAQVSSSQANFRFGSWPVGDVGAGFQGFGVGTTIQNVLSSTAAVLNTTISETLYDQTVAIGSNTTILSVTPASPPSTVSSAVISQNAIQSLTNAQIEVAALCTIQCYSAVKMVWSDEFCQFMGSAPTIAVWFYEVNNRIPNNGEIYQCRLLDSDSAGVEIWATRFHGCATTVIGPVTVGYGDCGTIPVSLVIPYGEVCQAFFTTGTPSSPPPPSPPATVCDGTTVTGVQCGNGVLTVNTAQICYTLDGCGHVLTIDMENASSYSTGGQSILCPPPSTSMPTLVTDIFYFGDDWNS